MGHNSIRGGVLDWLKNPSKVDINCLDLGLITSKGSLQHDSYCVLSMITVLERHEKQPVLSHSFFLAHHKTPQNSKDKICLETKAVRVLAQWILRNTI